jgi:hypothetical protein
MLQYVESDSALHAYRLCITALSCIVSCDAASEQQYLSLELMAENDVSEQL